jgi:archaellin
MFESCREFEDKRAYIVCEERRSKITFHNAAKTTAAKIRIDGCVIKDTNVKKCDYLLLCVEIKRAVFIELKGNKVMTAIEQLAATLENETVKKPLVPYEKRAYAVVTQNSIPNTAIQNAQVRFNKWNCALRIVKSPYTCDLASGKSIT